ncbi:MAG: hypothetical protein ACI87O_001321 [Planctomycetota bacterium]|jgi:hypothetical protein
MLWLVALILGWLLVEGQPSAGGSWSNPYFLSLETAHFSWGLLLVGLAACLWGAGKRALGWGFVLMLALGAWLPMLLLDAPFFRTGPWVATLVMVLMGAGLRFQRNIEPESDGVETGTQWTGILILGGACAAFCLHGLARILSRLGDAGPGSTSITLATLLTLMGLGAFAFGRPLPVDAQKRGRVHAFVWIALLLAVFAALRAEQTLGTSRGLRGLMRRFSLDASHAGTTAGELLSSVSVLILPAFALGTLVLVLRHAQRVSFVVLGAALGTFLVPIALSTETLGFSSMQPSLRLIIWGMLVLLPIAPIVWIAQGRKFIGGIVLLACVPLAFNLRNVLPEDPILAPKPWQRSPVEPVWQMETPQGQLTVTSDGFGAFQALLDQAPLTADGNHARLHDRCMAMSMGWRGAGYGPYQSRILLIGVLTPQIADRLQSLGAKRIDRLTPFGETVTKACEEALAGGQEIPAELGDRIDAEVAEARIRDGVYSLVLGLPVQNVSARPPRGLPISLVAKSAIWSSLEGLQGTRSTDRQGAICSDGLGRFAFAWNQDGQAEETLSGGAIFATLSPGDRHITRWRWGQLRPWDRSPLAIAHSLDSLAQQANENDAQLFQVLRDIMDSQEQSSPFETEFERFEIPRVHLESLVQVLIAGPDTSFYREIAGGLARTLVGKRDVGAIMEFLPGLSEAMGQPYELERSLARAELESLEPGAAAMRLQRLLKAWPREDSLLEELAIAYDQSDQPGLAVAVWEALRKIHPGEWPFDKAWTLSLVRAGDARGPAALQTALASHPEDFELLAVSQSGPLPPIKKGFEPRDGRHDEHEDH